MELVWFIIKRKCSAWSYSFQTEREHNSVCVIYSVEFCYIFFRGYILFWKGTQYSVKISSRTHPSECLKLVSSEVSIKPFQLVQIKGKLSAQSCSERKGKLSAQSCFERKRWSGSWIILFYLWISIIPFGSKSKEIVCVIILISISKEYYEYSFLIYKRNIMNIPFLNIPDDIFF